jgi:hypothetical protein
MGIEITLFSKLFRKKCKKSLRQNKCAKFQFVLLVTCNLQRFLANIFFWVNFFPIISVSVLLPENLHAYFELSAQAWILYKARYPNSCPQRTLTVKGQRKVIIKLLKLGCPSTYFQLSGYIFQ